MELHQSQMKLIRDQMNGFVRDLAALREAVTKLSSRQMGAAALEGAPLSKEQEGLREEAGCRDLFGEDIARVERMLKDSAEKQSWDCADVRQQHELLAMEFSKRARDVEELKELVPSVEERLAKIETSVVAKPSHAHAGK